MSRPGAFLFVPLLLAGSSGAAQNVARLERMWKDAARASSHVDSITRLRESIELDTVRRGNLVVLAPGDLEALAVDVADTTWARLEGTYGDQVKAPRHRPLVVALYRSTKGPAPYGYAPDAVAIPVANGSAQQMAAAQTVIALLNALRTDFDGPFHRWLGVAIRTDTASVARAELYEDLVTSPSPLARGCYVGSLRDCAEALGLIPTQDPATRWYDAAGRRELLRNLLFVTPNDALVKECIDAGVDAVCLRLLRGPDSLRVTPPLAPESRELLVRIALHAGGRRALQLLLDNPGQPIGRRLELAAGIPMDSLVRRWHTAVLATRPASVDLTPGVGWVALVWALVLGTLVLGSSRWRF